MVYFIMKHILTKDLSLCYNIIRLRDVTYIVIAINKEMELNLVY
jgi:hypothetical protein